MKFRIFEILLGIGIMLSCTLVFGQQYQSPLLRALVPRINQKHFQLIPAEQQYTLVINLPDGSIRIEEAELRKPGTLEEELHLTGTIHELFPEATAVTIYEAGRNGYTVKYRYKAERPPLPPLPTQRPLSLSPNSLKGSVG